MPGFRGRACVSSPFHPANNDGGCYSSRTCGSTTHARVATDSSRHAGEPALCHCQPIQLSKNVNPTPGGAGKVFLGVILSSGTGLRCRSEEPLFFNPATTKTKNPASSAGYIRCTIRCLRTYAKLDCFLSGIRSRPHRGSVADPVVRSAPVSPDRRRAIQEYSSFPHPVKSSPSLFSCPTVQISLGVRWLATALPFAPPVARERVGGKPRPCKGGSKLPHSNAGICPASTSPFPRI